MRQVLVLICAVVLTAACARPSSVLPNVSADEMQKEQAKQAAYHLQRLIADQGRVQTVGYRVVTANREFCGKSVAPKYGFGVLSSEDLPKEYRDAGRAQFGIGEQPTVINLVTDSPAAKAGLQIGDQIERAETARIAAGRRGTHALLGILQKQPMGDPLNLVVSRKGQKTSIAIPPVSGCSHQIVLALEDQTNAFTNGRQIVIQRGLLRIAAEDNELALVVGHELSHITSGHFSKKAVNQAVGTAGGVAVDVLFALAGVNTGGAFTRGMGQVGRKAFSQDFEKEADYVGLYYAARAGYDVRNVEKFWRKMADVDGGKIFFASTHPTSPERFLLIAKTGAEIETKRRAHQSLVPNQEQQTASR